MIFDLLILLINAVVVFGQQLQYAYGKERNYKWTVAEEDMVHWNKDIKLITINGRFPGPTIEVDSYDTIIVDVINNLDRDLTIHWHGMLQKGTVISDGVPYVTQDPIKSKHSYRYEFKVTDQAGTWYYHAHTGLDSEQLFGPLIVRDQPHIYKDLISYDNQFSYDEERIIALSEMRIKSSVAMVQGLKSAPFKWVGNPDYILTNGKSFNYNNNTNHTVIGKNKFNDGYQVIKVEQNRRYRIRIIGALEIMSIAFIIPNHKITLIEVEGTYIEPYQNSQGIVDIREGDNVQIVIEHFAMRDNSTTCIIHPWHLHGHSYYVVGYGSNNFTIKDQNIIDQSLRNSNKIPILRDTFVHYPGIVDQNSLEAKSSNFNVPSLKVAFSENQDFAAIKPNININNNPDEYVSCGWYAIRFIADNPGSWFMHCHITPHLVMGKFHIINELPRNYHINEYS
ncbi:hypothetical protein K502DRAFT_340896 [Neoconidiobolus thromboides FSU 785]|nr:hypothetical protein K502DRAFT_340896 [Neoconidiobolus thromboides FSU 785]